MQGREHDFELLKGQLSLTSDKTMFTELVDSHNIGTITGVNTAMAKLKPVFETRSAEFGDCMSNLQLLKPCLEQRPS